MIHTAETHVEKEQTGSDSPRLEEGVRDRID